MDIGFLQDPGLHSSGAVTCLEVRGNEATLQYFDALKQIAGSPSSKVVVPMELAGLAAGVAAFVNAEGDTKA